MNLIAFKYGETEINEKMAFQNGDKNVKIPIGLLFFLIETENRKILVDVGCDSMPGYDVSNFKKPVELLEEYGVHRDEITDVLITHAHNDHIGCLHYYTHANVYLQEDEFKVAGARIKETQNVCTFKDSIDICDKIVMRHIGGHSIGSSIVLIEDSKKEYVLCGDECYLKRNFLEHKPTGSSYCLERSISFVDTYSSDIYEKILFHDINLVEKTGLKKILS